MSRRQLRGVESISAAIDSGIKPSLLLVLEENLSPAAADLAGRAIDLGIPVHYESERELRRMSATEGGAEILALEGPPLAQTLDELMASDGIVFVLVGLRYPGNVGFILRSLEVAGGAGVVLDTDWEASQREQATRIGMRADRFFPLLEASAMDAIHSARKRGRRAVAVETSGTNSPWQIDLSRPTVVVMGSEATGIPASLLSEVDDTVAIPVGGFIPSYNVQAAVGIIVGEWLRQSMS